MDPKRKPDQTIHATSKFIVIGDSLKKPIIDTSLLFHKMRDLPVLSFLKGSLTVEAALVTPLFLFALISVIFIGEAIRFSGNLSASLLESAEKLSVYAYAGSVTSPDSQPGDIGGRVVSLTIGKGMVTSGLGRGYIEESPVENGVPGLSFIHSSVMGSDQMIDLSAVWRMKTLFPFSGVTGFKVIDRARIRAFTGYDNTGRDVSSEEEEEIVFITKSGTVYHKSRNCSHLNINIQRTDRANVGNLRNNSGGKYYPCEYCGGGTQDCLYVTDDGDRYHTKVSCPGLKRTIRAVPISQVGGRGPCHDCG